MWPLKLHGTGGSVSREPATRASVLAILPDSCDQRLLRDLAIDQQWNLIIVSVLDQALLRVSQETFPVVLLDRDVAGVDWRSCVRTFAQLRPPPSVVLISSVGDHYLFEELVRQGGFEVVAKPLQEDELRRVARLAFTSWKSRYSACRAGGQSANGRRLS